MTVSWASGVSHNNSELLKLQSPLSLRDYTTNRSHEITHIQLGASGIGYTSESGGITSPVAQDYGELGVT